MFLNKFSEKYNNEDGFTLIELLVVILIIGILTAIAVPVFLNQRQSAIDAGVQQELKGAATAVETWQINHPRSNIDSTALSEAKTSGDTTITLVSASRAEGYVLCAKNPNGGESAKGYTYRSISGGVKAESC